MDFEQVPVKECALGQECTLQFKDESFEEGERLQVVDVLNGLNSHIFMTSDGYNFSLSLENATEGPEESDGVDDGPFLLAEPGLYQIRHCFGDSTCDGQWFALPSQASRLFVTWDHVVRLQACKAPDSQ